MGRGERPSPVKNCLKRILQTELQLAHGDATCQAVNSAKSEVGGGRRLTGSYSAVQDAGLGSSKVRMVQCIESFRTELHLVMFVVGHAEVLVYFGVDSVNS